MKLLVLAAAAAVVSEMVVVKFNVHSSFTKKILAHGRFSFFEMLDQMLKDGVENGAMTVSDFPDYHIRLGVADCAPDDYILAGKVLYDVAQEHLSQTTTVEYGECLATLTLSTKRGTHHKQLHNEPYDPTKFTRENRYSDGRAKEPTTRTEHLRQMHAILNPSTKEGNGWNSLKKRVFGKKPQED